MKKLYLFLTLTALLLAGCAGGSARPKAGATFSGPINISPDNAQSATLTFTISDDGTAITKVGVSFTKFKCEAMSAGQISTSSTGNFSIADGFDISPSSIGEIKGRFTSATRASGTIHLQLKINTGFGTASCDAGTWDWNAEAK